MSLRSTLTYITNHPLNKDQKVRAVRRFFSWQLVSRLLGYSFIYPWTKRSRLIIRKGMTGATGNYYCGLHDFNDMSFLLHFLRKGDLFVDVGANVGSYTVLAAAHCGTDTCCFEPVPSTFRSLMDNIAINHIGNITKAFNMAVGSEKGVINFTSRFDTINHVVEGKSENSIEVEVNTLDSLLPNASPSLIKVDVEGYEYHVIQGAKKTLANPSLKAIIIELNGLGSNFGFSDQSIHEELLSFGFRPYVYEPLKRELSKIDSFGHHNTMYVRDEAFVQQRIREAESIQINGKIY